jgi:hypothetical protein
MIGAIRQLAELGATVTTPVGSFENVATRDFEIAFASRVKIG